MTKRAVPAETPSGGAELIGYAVSWIVAVGALVFAVVPLLAIVFATFRAVKAGRSEWRRLPDSTAGDESRISPSPRGGARLGWRS